MLERQVSLRYYGQNFEQDVPLEPGPITPASLDRLLDAFHARHEELYGYAMRDSVIELVHFNVTGRGPERRIPPISIEVGARAERARPVRFREGWLDCRIVPRAALREGDDVVGPAIIDERDSTTLIPPRATARVGASGVLVIGSD